MRHDIVRIAVVVAGLICAAGGLALGGATWSGQQPYTLAVPEHITGTGAEQARSGSLDMPLDHDTPCTITVSVAKAGDEVLASAGDTLVTSYKLTGAALQNGGDGDWVDSSTFLTRNYSVPETGPPDGITIWVRAAAGSGRANNAGTYSASVILTASW